jgi:hypothetical protein
VKRNDGLLQRWSVPATVSLAVIACGSFLWSLLYGTPDPLPGVALGLPILLHVERALAVMAGFALLFMFLGRGWEGDFPRGFSASGLNWQDTSGLVDEALTEQLTEVAERLRSSEHDLSALRELLEGQVESEAVRKQLAETLNRIQENLARGEQEASLARRISTLPEREKLVIALTRFEGLTIDEVAEVLGMSRLRTALLERRALMRLEGDNPEPGGDSV